MRAPEDDGVDRARVGPDQAFEQIVYIGSFEVALLDAGGQTRTWGGDDLVAASPLLGQLLVLVEPKRYRRRHDENALDAWRRRGGLQSRFDSDDGDVGVIGPKFCGSGRRRRVAGHDDGFHALVEQAVDDVA